MNQVIIIRMISNDDGTFGHLIHGDFHVYTLEPEAARKGNKGRIPAGIYPVVWEPEGRFQGYALKEVPGFENVEIHLGNTEVDTAGCILLGLRRGRLKEKEAVLASRQAINRFEQHMGWEDFELEIIERYSN